MDNVKGMRDARSRGRGSDGGTRSARPKSPSLSPMPHQRMAISRQRATTEREPRAVLFPPDWQCPTPECVNHTKMVFAKRSQCPICGAAKPSSTTGGSKTERMSGAVYRRYQPANRDVSPGRDSRGARRYMVCSESVGPSCAAPLPPQTTRSVSGV